MKESIAATGATGGRRLATEIWVYGSVARGTQSPSSDLDILVVSDTDPKPSLVSAAVAGLPQLEHLSMRCYSWREIEQMADYGSLFLLHLKLEAHLLHTTNTDTGLVDFLARLPPYQNEVRDIRGFTQALDDIGWALGDALDEDDILFELGAIATVIRHCSILACYKIGAPRFQLNDSIGTSFAAVGMSEFSDSAIDLYQFRLAASRQIPAQTRPGKVLADLWLGRAQQYINKVGNL